MKKRAVLVFAVGGLLAANVMASNLAERGKKVFTQEAQPSCTICHALSDAGSSGEIGPNLDELAPSEDQVRNAVTSGVGIMPAFKESLTEEQINAVARYVSSVTSGK